MEVLLAKFSNHFVAKYKDVGKANKEAMRIQTGYSLIRSRTIVLTSAPMAFRIQLVPFAADSLQRFILVRSLCADT